MYRLFFKRFLDITLSLIAIIVLSPILLIVAILVKKKLGAPVIFKQKRPGMNEKIFTMYKFRTMTDEKNEYGKLLSDEARLTKFGKLLRSTSLDELPELFNIVKGDMSIVGPRPLLIRDMVFMTIDQRERHSVRPGLSGLAQVNGRNSITWEDKLNLDNKYITNICFSKDFKIVFKTFIKVLKKEDVTSEGMVTAEDYGDYLLNKKKISNEEYNIKQKEAIDFIIGKG